jgi:hypothetical protein
LLSFFRVNAAYQMISLVVFFLLLRLPFFFGGIPLLIPELSWMLVGEQMNHGFMLYRDIWDNVSPFSGLTYWLIDSLFGRAQWAYQLAAAALGIIQILYFNYVIYSREVFPERTFIPGALYAIFLNISFDLGTLSPMLMANTFLLFAFGLIVKILVRREATNQVFEMGLYIGIATLFYLPATLFMVWAFLALLFYTGATIRHHLLGLFGSLFPLLMVLLYFYMNDGIESLNRNLLTSVFQVKQYNLTDFSSLLASLLLPLGFGVLGFTRIFTTLRFVNYQDPAGNGSLVYRFRIYHSVDAISGTHAVCDFYSARCIFCNPLFSEFQAQKFRRRISVHDDDSGNRLYSIPGDQGNPTRHIHGETGKFAIQIRIAPSRY